MALLGQNDYHLAWFLYGAAALLLILSLTYPSLSRHKTPAAVADASNASVPPADAPRMPGTAGLHPNVAASLGNGAGGPHAGASGAAPLALPEVPGGVRPAATLPVRSVRRAASRNEPLGGANVPPALETSGEERVIARGMPESAPAEPGAKRAAQPAAYQSPASTARGWARWAELREGLGWKITVPGVVVSLTLAGASAAVLLGDLANPVGGWLWAASLVVLLLTFLGAPGWPRGEGLFPGPDSGFLAPGVPRVPLRLEGVLVVVMMLVAVFMRVYSLEYPPGIFGDEGEQAMDVRAIIEGKPTPIFGSGWWGVPNLSFYLWQFTLRIFGDDTMVGVRMFSVISGLVSVWFIYKIGRLLWGQRVGLIAGFMLAVSPLALQFSRFANVSSETAALWAVGAYFLFMALRYRRWSDWVLSGFFWSFNLYFYPAGKLIIPLVGLIGLYCLVRWRKEFFKQYLLGFVLLGVSFAITFMPMAVFSSLDRWQSFAGRAGETSIFSPQNQASTFARYNLPYDPIWATRSTLENFRSDPGPWVQLVYQQARETFDALNRRGDAMLYYRIEAHNGTVLSPFWAVLTLLGLAYALWKIWDPRYGIALIWFAIGLSASILTVDTPNLQRFTGAWTVVMLFPAVLLDRVFAAAWPFSKAMARRWATVPLALLLIYFGTDSFQEYYGHYASLCPFCDATVQARYVDGLGQDYKGYEMGVGGYDIYFGYGSTRYLAKGVEGRDVLAAADSLPITDNNGKGAAFLIYPNNADYLPLVRQYYPSGREERESTPTGQDIFTSYEVTLDQLEARRASFARYSLQNGHMFERKERGIGTGPGEWAPPDGLGYPARAQWRAGLVAPSYGVYSLAVEGAPGTRLEVDGKTLAEVQDGADRAQGELVLAKGVHEVLLEGALPSADAQVRLLWAGAGAPLEPVSTLYLWDGPDGGLLADVGQPGVSSDQAYLSPDPFAGAPPAVRRVDPFVGYRVGSELFGNGIWLARWRGKVLVPADDTYTFTMTSQPVGWIAIDGQTVLGVGPDGPGPGAVALTRGEHDIEIRYLAPGAPGRVEVMWSSPSMQAQIIPPTALRPLERSWRPDDVLQAPAGTVPEGTPAEEVVLQPLAVYSEGDLARPRGIAVDAQGNAFVGDRGNSRIVVYSRDGKVLRTWGSKAPEPSEGQTPDQIAVQPGQFFDINDVAVGADGLVYVLDLSNRVQIFTPEGEYRGSYEPAQLSLYGPNGLGSGHVAGRDSVVIAVTGQNRLVSLPQFGEVQSGQLPLPGSIMSVAPQGSGAFEQPVDVAIDPTGSGLVYAIDLHDRIVQLKQSDAGAWEVARQWPVPVGRNEGGSRLAVSPDGQWVFMSDPDRKRVAWIDVNAGAVHYFGKPGSGPGEFGGPSGIAVGPDGKVYVVDRDGANVQVFEPGEK
jgi:DNA-binding beta-propeller fold protein YncE